MGVRVLSCPTTRALPLFAASILALTVGACTRVPWQPAEAQLERIVPDETVPLDQFGTFTPSVSRGCRFVSVTSNHQVYVFDRRNKRFVLASAAPSGDPAAYSSHRVFFLAGGVAMSPDGSCVAFESYASNLVPEDGDGRVDVFVRGLR